MNAVPPGRDGHGVPRPSVTARLTAALGDRYRLECEVGAGGMATVYLAHDLKHERQVAVKVLRPELAAVIGRTGGTWGEPVRRLDHGFWPGWSPDGRQLVFSTSLSAGSIGIVPVDSGPERIVLDAALGIQSDTPFWMPGGRELIFRARNEEGRRSIYVMPVEGGTPRIIAAADNAASGVRGGWAFGGDQVFLGVTEQESDVSVMEVESR